MFGGVRRRVTRAYVVALIAAALIIAAALVIVTWGTLGLYLGREPVETVGIPLWFGILSIGAALALLASMLWNQAVSLLRGNVKPAWRFVVIGMAGSFLIWCLLGSLMGLSINETWLSPFAGVLAPVWGVVTLAFWAVLARRIYTDRPPPRWPWEKREERERAEEDERERKREQDED